MFVVSWPRGEGGRECMRAGSAGAQSARGRRGRLGL